MQNIQEIEKAISKLSEKDLSDFRAWFQTFDQDHWDKQFEDDAKTGKLDQLAGQAIKEYKAGQCKEI